MNSSQKIEILREIKDLLTSNNRVKCICSAFQYVMINKVTAITPVNIKFNVPSVMQNYIPELRHKLEIRGIRLHKSPFMNYLWEKDLIKPRIEFINEIIEELQS